MTTPAMTTVPSRKLPSSGRTDHGYARYSNKEDPRRCEVCREAKRDYIAERRSAGLEPMRAGVVAPPKGRRKARLAKHGTRTGYRRGCRCRDCTNADRFYDRYLRPKRRARAS